MRKQIEIPTKCPSCSTNLELVNAQLFCRNIMCSARARKNVEYFAKTIGIKGLGPSTIEKLNIQHYIELYGYTEEYLVSSLGSSLVGSKIYQEIQRSKSANFCTIITAFGISRVGKTVAQKLSVISSIKDITKEKCMELGLGEVASTNLMDFLQSEFKDIEEYLPFPQLYNNVEVASKPLAKKLICITGKLQSFKTKKEAAEVLESLGYEVIEKMNKSVQILVDEEDRNSLSRQKAEKMGIQIISNLLTFIEEEKNT